MQCNQWQTEKSWEDAETEREARYWGPGYAICGGFKMNRNTGAAGQMMPIRRVIGFDEIQVLPVERWMAPPRLHCVMMMNEIRKMVAATTCIVGPFSSCTSSLYLISIKGDFNSMEQRSPTYTGREETHFPFGGDLLCCCSGSQATFVLSCHLRCGWWAGDALVSVGTLQCIVLWNK